MGTSSFAMPVGSGMGMGPFNGSPPPQFDGANPVSRLRKRAPINSGPVPGNPVGGPIGVPVGGPTQPSPTPAPNPLGPFSPGHFLGLPQGNVDGLKSAPRPMAMGDPNGGIVNPSPPGTPGAQIPQATSGPFTPQMFSMGEPRSANTTGFQSEFLNSGNYAGANEGNLVSRSSGILDFASGNPQDSPLYKALLSGSRSSIGSSYDQAVANTRAASASRGFGYESPAETGMESGERAQEAGAFAQAPSQALEQTIAPEMQAAGIDTSQAAMYGGQQMSYDQMVTALQQARMGKQASLTSTMAQFLGDYMKSAAAAGAGGGG